MTNTAKPKNTHLVFRVGDEAVSIKLLDLLHDIDVMRVIKDMAKEPKYKAPILRDKPMYQTFWGLREQSYNTKFINCIDEVNLDG